MNIFYLYKNDDKFISITGLIVGQTGLIKHAAIWENLKGAKSWENKIKSKFPNAKLEMAGLHIIEDEKNINENKKEIPKNTRIPIYNGEIKKTTQI